MDIIKKPLIVGDVVRFLGDETLGPIPAEITDITTDKYTGETIYILSTMHGKMIKAPRNNIKEMYGRGGSKRRKRRRTKQRKLSKKRKSTKKTKRKKSKRKKTKRRRN
jgi:hypothetical protein